MTELTKIGIAGCGALGSIVLNALQDGITGYSLTAVSDLTDRDFSVPNLPFDELAEQCDFIVECLPPHAVPDLAHEILKRHKNMIMISACSVLLYPQILDMHAQSQGRIIIPSGALSGLDAVSALNSARIDQATIASTKPPSGFKNAPYVIENKIDLESIKSRTLIFKGNAYDAAKAFPANVNVAATLALAGLGPEKTMVEVWADPATNKNSHEITVIGGNSTITTKVENTPDPNNPKSSMLAGYSVIATLKKLTGKLAVL